MWAVCMCVEGGRGRRKALVGILNRDTLSFWEFEIWLYVIFGLNQILDIFQIKK